MQPPNESEDDGTEMPGKVPREEEMYGVKGFVRGDEGDEVKVIETEKEEKEDQGGHDNQAFVEETHLWYYAW